MVYTDCLSPSQPNKLLHVQVVRMGADNTVQIMERAIEAGHSVLIENMGESVDAVLLPIITRSTVKKGRNLFVKLGDKDVEYNRNFKLFMHTKLSNPHYPPEIQAETTLINFTVTEKVSCVAIWLALQSSLCACTCMMQDCIIIISWPLLLPLLCTGSGRPAAGSRGEQRAT
jgi:hypothetical protein